MVARSPAAKKRWPQYLIKCAFPSGKNGGNRHVADLRHLNTKIQHECRVITGNTGNALCCCDDCRLCRCDCRRRGTDYDSYIAACSDSTASTLATNKLQGSFGSLTATVMFIRRRLVQLSDVRILFLCSFAGAGVGACAVQLVQAQALDIIIPVVLISIALYFLCAPTAGNVDGRPRVTDMLYRRLVVPVIGFYDGMFGPGAGSFFPWQACPYADRIWRRPQHTPKS